MDMLLWDGRGLTICCGKLSGHSIQPSVRWAFQCSCVTDGAVFRQGSMLISCGDKADSMLQCSRKGR